MRLTRACVVLATGLLAACSTVPAPVPVAAHGAIGPPDALALAAGSGDARAQHDLGRRYLTGDGVPVDPKQAAAWFLRAAEQGYAPAQTEMGNAYVAGVVSGVPDYTPALGWYGKAAAQGEIVATFNLGRMYDRGLGVASDPARAVEYYRVAAAAGHVGAETNLAINAWLGRGMAADPALAFAWFGKAAAEGDPIALYNRGVMAEKGLGTTRDLDLAERVYRNAAARGSVEAQAALGRLLVVHRGEPEEGLFWLEVATLHAPDAAARRVYAGDRDQVRRQLTPEQAAEIAERAAAWRAA